jgi:dTDP-4-amino-4,6-dideoxygalactose transaminase/predicted O-linked N-acetylglucosamine transferase (SPINDLY family)
MQEPMHLPPGDEAALLASEAMDAARLEVQAGRRDQAGALYLGVLSLVPGHAGAHFGLAQLARMDGRLDEAIAHFAEALQASPAEEPYWLAYLDALLAARAFATAQEVLELGRAHGLQGAAVDAIARRLAECQAQLPAPHDIEAAAALFAQGRMDEAAGAADALSARFPWHPFGYKLLGAVRHARGDAHGAIAAMRAAFERGPDDFETVSNLGMLLKGARRLREAEEVLAHGIALQPESAVAHNNLAVTLMEAERLEQAYASAVTAVALDPLHVESANTLAAVLARQGRSREAVAAYRRVLELQPAHTDAHSNMLFCMSQMEDIAPRALFEAHRAFGRELEARLGPPRGWDNTRERERRLRIGFVSGDLRNHAVASFIAPVLRHLADRPGVALYAYYTYPVRDAESERLRAYMEKWVDAALLDDEALDAAIRADGIDILIDLAGHTAYNRLPLFARKPAPVQATWVGYPFSTGLAAMDYYITDRFILPPGQFDHLFTEKLLHLPVSSPFQPAADAPSLAPLPALANGHVTFGSFNKLSKISRAVAALWGRLLHALPDARLVLAGMPEDGSHGDLLGWLAEEGVAAERVHCHPRLRMQDYLALHNRVDINLDTFPYSGGTTTLHALYMGVPTLTLAGETAAGRQTACILEHHGLPQFIAADADDFVARGVKACADLQALAALRAGMRKGFPAVSGDVGRKVADSVEKALRVVWRHWCAGHPPVGFQVAPGPVRSAPPVPAPVPDPATRQPIYVTQPDLPPLADFVASLEQIWESKFLTNGGRFHQELESALCAHLGVQHVSLFANGTIALMTALQALGIKGEVITTPYSFVATAHALLWNGLQPVFADVDPLTFNLDPAGIEAAITPRTTAIMPVHVYGTPCDVEGIEAIARRHGLKVIYDAAHAFGVRQHGRSILRHGDLSVLSFHATKVFNTFEGGAIVSHDSETKRRIDQLRNFGIVDEVTVVAAGINGKMNEVSAAFGLLQLKSVDAALDRRRQIAARYRRLLAGVPGIAPMAEPRHEANYGYFPVLVGEDFAIGRDALYQLLRDEGIHARRYFSPLITDFPMYAQLPSAAPGRLPVASSVARQVLCLPIYPALEDAQVERIAGLIRGAGLPASPNQETPR